MSVFNSMWDDSKLKKIIKKLNLFDLFVLLLVGVFIYGGMLGRKSIENKIKKQYESDISHLQQSLSEEHKKILKCSEEHKELLICSEQLKQLEQIKDFNQTETTKNTLYHLYLNNKLLFVN